MARPRQADREAVTETTLTVRLTTADRARLETLARLRRERSGRRGITAGSIARDAIRRMLETCRCELQGVQEPLLDPADHRLAEAIAGMKLSSADARRELEEFDHANAAVAPGAPVPTLPRAPPPPPAVPYNAAGKTNDEILADAGFSFTSPDEG
jgi:hypothetical protein